MNKFKFMNEDTTTNFEKLLSSKLNNKAGNESSEKMSTASINGGVLITIIK